MSVEFVFGGQSLTLATSEEFREAVMLGQFVSRAAGLITYSYRGKLFLLSDSDLAAARAPQGSETPHE